MKNKYCVKRVLYEQTKPLILNVHYARRMPQVRYAFGLFEGNKLIGVVTYGVPASNTLCKGIAGEWYKDDVLELNRLVIIPDKIEKNLASYLISKSIKMLPHGKILVSYADTGWGHVGYVYQSTNWLYTGMTKQRTDRYNAGKHSRHYDKEEIRRTIRTAKHRYVNFTGTKRDKKRLRRALKYPVYDKYPKGDNVLYDESNPVPVNDMIGKVIE